MAPHSKACDEALHRDVAAPIDLHFGAGGDVAAFLHASRNAEAACGRTFFPSPAEFFCRCVKHSNQARIVEILQTKLQRVHAHQMGQFIHVSFAGKVIGGRRQTTVRTLAQRGIRRVKFNLLVGDVVGSADGRRPGIVVVELPGDDRAVFAHAALHIDHAGRTEIGPGKLFLARPDQLSRACPRPSPAARLLRRRRRCVCRRKPSPCREQSRARSRSACRKPAPVRRAPRRDAAFPSTRSACRRSIPPQRPAAPGEHGRCRRRCRFAPTSCRRRPILAPSSRQRDLELVRRSRRAPT